ncbi:hypothetical protein SAMN05216469_12510 [Ruminococcus albus]|uniref:Uncharacterized protein n=2 Tax=Ruminococcus albus TaxID=1264 RepID=A0A1H7PT51_RUMAL|nr:hypothetical protein SAMN05216469_12510 [Ruminococcus albus]
MKKTIKQLIRDFLKLIAAIVIFCALVYFIIDHATHRTIRFFGDDDIEMIHKRMSITIEGNTTPVKFEETHGAGDYSYYLWLKNIDDPEEFMENCYDGTYSVVDNVNDLKKGFGDEGRDYDYNNDLRLGSAYIAYNCDRYIEYNIVFYKDEDSYKAKLYANQY